VAIKRLESENAMNPNIASRPKEGIKPNREIGLFMPIFISDQCRLIRIAMQAKMQSGPISSKCLWQFSQIDLPSLNISPVAKILNMHPLPARSVSSKMLSGF
jgi:hypothetical protein